MLHLPKSIFLLLVLSALAAAAQAQNKATQLIRTGQLTGSTSITEDNTIDLEVRKNLLPNPIREKMIAARLFVRLGLGEDHIGIPDADYSLEVPYRIWMLDEAGQPLGGTWIQENTISIDEIQAEKLQVLDFFAELSTTAGFSKIRLEISGPPALQVNTDSPPGLQTFIENNQRVSVKSEVNFLVDVRRDASETLVDAPIIVPKNETNLTNRVQTFTWKTNGYDFPNYELQILRLYNNDPSREDNLDEIGTEVNWDNALRIETQSSDTSFTLTIGEGTGFYLWRVRPVGTYFPGGIANSENYGPWSSALPSGSTVALNRNSISLPEAFHFRDPDQDFNWIYNRVFTEGNQMADGTRTSEGISYADGLLNLRQSQVYNSANRNLLITQNVLDYSGRPALNSLPVPVSGDMNTGYRVNFVQNDDGGLYTATDYDTSLYSPSIINDDGTDFAYYSNSNADLSIPNAEGYAFKRTLFKTDGTGRVAEESGVGRVHALGTQTDGQGRTTRILYGNPSDDELIRIFGDEAPLAETVTKTITIDPNNVASVTYASAIQGNVIATALATIETNNLDPLEAGGSPFSISDTIEQNFWSNRKFISYKRLVLPYLADVLFGYDLDCQSGGWGCLGGDCSYEVQFTITDLQRQHIYQSQRYPVSCGNVDLNGLMWTAMTPGAPSLNATGASVTLEAGEYVITKALMDELPVNFAVETTNAAFAETQELIDAIAALMQDVDNAEEYVVFANSMVLLEDYFANGDDAAIIQLLNLPADFVIPADFGFSFDPTEGTNDPAQLSFEPACCPSSSISITKPDICIACEYIDDVREETPPEDIPALIQDTVYKYFIVDVLDSHLAEEGLPDGYFNTIAPGFTRQSMAFMLTQMLASQYYTGNSKQHANGNWYKAVHDGQGELVFAKQDNTGKLVKDPDNNPVNNTPSTNINHNNSFNYENCKQLYNCWTQAVNMIGNYTAGDSTNIMDEFNGRQGDKASEGHYDDDEALDKSSIGDKILGFVISIKMRKFNNSDDGIIRPARVASILSLPSLFMECAGYQFSAIIDGESIAPPDDYTYNSVSNPDLPPTNSDIETYLQNLNVSADHGNYAPMIFDFETGEYPDTPRLYYPYILLPEWMFKYFVYNVSDDDYFQDVGLIVNDYDRLLPDHLDIEINSCYNPPNCSFDDGEDHSSHNLCFRPCNYYHANWNSGQRLNFYNLIRNAPVDPDIRLTLDSIFMDITGQETVPTCAPLDTLIQEAYNQLAVIESNLPSRALLFRSRVEQMLLDSCYQIVDCAPGEGQVSEQQIGLMVQGVIQVIRDKIQIVYEHVGIDFDNDGEIYPNCREITCHWVNSNNECEERQELEITYFAPCDQLILDQIQYWNFLPYGIESQCETSSGGPGLAGNQYDGDNCIEEKDYSETYNVTNASLSGGN